MTLSDVPLRLLDGYTTTHPAIPAVAKAFAADAPREIEDFLMLARDVPDRRIVKFRVIVRHSVHGKGWADTSTTDELLQHGDPQALAFVAGGMLEAIEINPPRAAPLPWVGKKGRKRK